jgi:type I restriction-modification system DNA methylase subunit
MEIPAFSRVLSLIVFLDQPHGCGASAFGVFQSEMQRPPNQISEFFGKDSLERLVPVADFRKNTKLSAEDYLALEKAEQHKATYVYFRHNIDRSSSMRFAQAYVYDHTQEPLFAAKGQHDLADLHKELWNACPVPLFMVFLHSEVQIFSSLKAPKLKGKKVEPAPLEVIKLAAKVQRGIDLLQTRIRELDIGIFWDSSKNTHLRGAKRENSVYGLMLQQLRDTRKLLIRGGKLDQRHANRLLVMALLVRYLEERTDSQGRGVFPKAGETRNGKTYKSGFFEEFSPGAADFTTMVRKRGNIVGLFDRLSKRFNGDVFCLSDEQRSYLAKADLSGLADFLGGQAGKQTVFWPLYSFNHLPVELISNIYEAFLGADKKQPDSEDFTQADGDFAKKKEQGIVYTPPFLVDFLLAESMPLTGPTRFRVLDPSCGSGVFLVGAYRRLIARWRVANNWKHPDLDCLQSLLRENIFGVDLDSDAASLTVFSLCIALCSELEPMEIWKNLHFDPLRGKNIIEGDFFGEIDKGTWSKSQEKFDLIVGNPPFAEKLTPKASAINEKLVTAKIRPELPNKQVALLFLDQAMPLLKPKGLACLILPAAPFLYNQGGQTFRKAFLERYDVPEILDFTHACRVVFGPGGDVAFVAVFARHAKPSSNVLHVTVRRTRSVKEHIGIELDRYDFHLVPREIALNEPTVWKANLVGGGRMSHLARRLAAMPTLGGHVAEQGNTWKICEGLIIGNRRKIARLEALSVKKALSVAEETEIKELRKEYKQADYLRQIPHLPARAFTKNGVNENAIVTLKERFFDTLPNEEMFRAPLILIKEQISEDGLICGLRESDISYGHRMVGIHAPAKKLGELKQIYSRLKENRTIILHLLLTSPELAVGRSSSVLQADLENIPYPTLPQEMELNEWETVLREDALKHWLEYRRKGEAAKVMREVDDSQLKVFGKTFSEYLSSIYRGLRADLPRKTATHICYPFFFKKAPKLPDSFSLELDEALQGLTQRHHRPGVRITRIIRIYEGDVIYLIKPKTMRYWLQSMAIRDADDTFGELTKQGL